MKDVAYLSRVRIERQSGPNRLAYLPAEAQPVRFGVHGAVAEHYGLTGDKLPEPHATTLDYVVAATGGCLTGTFGGALEARQINASGGRLAAEAEGEIETEERVLIIKRIRVIYHLQAPEADRETAERVHAMHQRHCPVYMSLHRAIDIRTELRFEPL